ncbi:MAG: lamin tail domain-containing protein [Pedosphaera sp.]|nr:lamin tail domain-containing protein [Pedosphaera sp.]
MKPSYLGKVVSLTIAALLAVSSQVSAQVVINEIGYDDSGSDDHEFVELYNAGASAVDISGWTLGGRDNAGNNFSAVVPAATSIAAGGYYVFGNTAVASKNQTIALNFIENDAEQIELWAGAFNTSTLVDGVVTEANKGAGAATTQYGTPSAAMLAQIGGGYRGNFQSGHINGQGAQAGGTGPILVSLSRFSNGLDANVNGRDFGLRRSTPGAANSSTVGTLYTGPNVDSLTVGVEAPGLYASFVNPRVINPTVVSTHNPSAISLSPQGGNAVTVWDTEFGGTGAGLDTIMQGGSGKFSMLVYVDPRLTAAADSEEWIVGLGGGADALHNFWGVAGTVNGSTGLGWAFRRDGTTRTLQLIDFGLGTAAGSWSILGTVPNGA